MAHRPPRRLGSILGLGTALALVLLDGGLVALILTSPVNLLTVVRAIVALLTLLLMGVILFGVSGLRSASYRVDRNAITIRWGKVQQVIPLSDVEGVALGEELGKVTRFRGLRWPGFWVGRGWIDGVGAVQFYSGSSFDRQLVIRTPVASYAISPQAPGKFLDLLTTQRAMGALEAREHRLIQPQRGQFDRVGVALVALGGVLNLGLFILVGIRYSALSHTLPLHYDLAGLPDRTGAPRQLFAFSGLGSAIWLLDAVLGGILYRRARERTAAYLLWGAAVAVQLLVGIGLVGLMGA